MKNKYRHISVSLGSPLPSPDCWGFVKRQHEKSHWVEIQPRRNHLSDHKVTWVDSWVWSEPVAAQIQKVSLNPKNSCSEIQSRCLRLLTWRFICWCKSFSRVTTAKCPWQKVQCRFCTVISYLQYAPSKELPILSETLKVPLASSLVIFVHRVHLC